MFQDLLIENYHLIKALHILAMVAWMAGLLYLPRLFVYHHRFAPGTLAYETFSQMEGRLLRIIMMPAMIAVFIFGLLLAGIPGIIDFHQYWFHVKFILVLVLAGLQGMMTRWAREFSTGHPPHSEKFFRILNEIPFLLLIAIVFLVIFKPL